MPERDRAAAPELWTYVEAVDVWIAAVEEQAVAMQELREQSWFADCFALLEEEPDGA